MPAVLAAVAAFVTAVTALWPDWIEIVFGVEPDGGDGSLEWAISLTCGVVAVLLALWARRSWKRNRLTAN